MLARAVRRVRLKLALFGATSTGSVSSPRLFSALRHSVRHFCALFVCVGLAAGLAQSTSAGQSCERWCRAQEWSPRLRADPSPLCPGSLERIPVSFGRRLAGFRPRSDGRMPSLCGPARRLEALPAGSVNQTIFPGFLRMAHALEHMSPSSSFPRQCCSCPTDPIRRRFPLSTGLSTAYCCPLSSRSTAGSFRSSYVDWDAFVQAISTGAQEAAVIPCSEHDSRRLETPI